MTSLKVKDVEPVVGAQAHLGAGALGEPFRLGFEFSRTRLTCQLRERGDQHGSQEFPQQPGVFGLESGGGAQAYLDLPGRQGQAVVKLADQRGNPPGRCVAKVGVAAEVMGDDSVRILGG